MRDLSTNEELYLSKEATSVPHFCPNKSKTLRTSRYGFNYRSTHQPRLRCYPHDSRPWMFTSSNIPPMSHNNYWTTNCPKILATPLPLVWITRQDYFGSRPVIYIALWKGIDTRIGDPAKHINSLSSPNRRSYGTNEPMGGAIPAPHPCKSTRLEYLVTHGHGSTQ